MPRKTKPYFYALPEVTPQPRMPYQQSSVSTTEGGQQQQQQQQPQLPSGLLRELLSRPTAAPANVLPSTSSIMGNAWGQTELGQMAATNPWGELYTGADTSLGLSSQFGGDLGLVDSLGSSGAFDLGTAGSTAGEAGLGLGADAAATGAATGAAEAGAAGAAAAEGGAAASGAATGAMAAIPVWGWAALAASLAKSQVKGADRTSPAGIADTLLMPSIDQWMADPVRSNGNILDPAGTVIGDLAGVNDKSWYSLFSPAGFAGLFG